MLAGASILVALPAAAHDIHYTGRATGIKGTLTVADPANPIRKDVLIVDVPMSCSGNAREETASAVSTPSPLLIQAKTVNGYTVGTNNVSTAKASIETLRLEIGGHTVEATALHSHAIVTCDESITTTRAEGGASFATLKIDGRSYVDQAARPNQKITVPGFGEVIFNEQSMPSNYKTSKEIVVTALHIKVAQPQTNTNGDVWLAQSRAKARCIRSQ